MYIVRYQLPTSLFFPAFGAMLILTHWSFFHGDNPLPRGVKPLPISLYYQYVLGFFMIAGKAVFGSFVAIWWVTALAWGAHFVEMLYSVFLCSKHQVDFPVNVMYILGTLMGGFTQLGPMKDEIGKAALFNSRKKTQ